MIDFEQIGRRIYEERKYLHRISQEKMAYDLGMYQADISNLEKAKKGSGITDLSRLDMIADYFDMPLEILLFGRRQDQMEKYYGSKMQLTPFTKARPKKHDAILRGLTGMGEKDPEIPADAILSFECGPYMVYVLFEKQVQLTGKQNTAENQLTKAHIYVIYQDEVIGCLTSFVTTVMQHVFRPSFEILKQFIWPDIFDLDETLATLNPYWLLSQYSLDEEEAEDYRKKMYQRMDELRKAGENRIIHYVESAFVREDCRKNGVFRMMIDVLKKLNPNAMIWLSMEPTAGDDLDSEFSFHASYKVSEIGQINLNASIAEHLGFSIDPTVVSRQVERVEENGSVVVDTVPVRRIAYYLPKAIRNILNDDKDLLPYAKARRKLLGGGEEKPHVFDIFQGAWKEFGYIIAIKFVYQNETVFVFARGMDWKSRWLGVSRSNPAQTGEFVETIEKYDRLENAANSKYYIGLRVAEQLLGSIYFGTVNPEDVELGILPK